MTQQGSVSHASHEGVHVLRFSGEVRYPLSPAVEQFLQQLFETAMPAGFVVDLTETESIDSTNLGLIARIAERMRKCGGTQVTIVSDQPDINDLLAGMGFDSVFRIVETSRTLPAGAQLLTEDQADQTEITDIVLEAHRALMTMNDRNREMFSDVVEAIQREQKDNRVDG